MLNRIIAGVVGFIVLVFAIVWFRGKEPVLKLPKPVAAIGSATPVSVEVSDANGLKSVAAYLEQGGQRQAIFEDKSKTKQPVRLVTFSAGKKQAAFLKEGPAKLTIEAASYDFRGAKGKITQDVQVVLRPPTIVPDGMQHYINQGGAELVMFDLGGAYTESGVHAGKYLGGSFPMPGQPDSSNKRFSLFPYPYDLSPDTIPVTYVKNIAGTEVTASFWTKIFPKTFRSSDIDLDKYPQQVQKVVSELDPEGTGDVIERFVKINREMRKANNEQIYELRLKTENKILWSGPFIPMKGARESYFADRRSYLSHGKKVDEQFHLGFDLAQKTNMPVTAANSGKVVYADRLGIYGNCVVIDHGYALQTLYGHMSRIDVKVGDAIGKQQQIGLSGMTGMAFGDHVHFSMMVSGVQINPIEWWDEHWIHDRILSKIGPQATGKAAAASGETSGAAVGGEKKTGRRKR